jgi:para-nitrobenzyl esterase
MGVPALRLTDELSRRGRTFAYRFDWHAPALGAFHACDLPFTFGTLDADGWGEFVGADPDAHALSSRMRRAWAGFARTGDPGWDEYDPERRSTIVLGRDDHVAEHPVAARRHHFEQEGLT